MTKARLERDRAGGSSGRSGLSTSGLADFLSQLAGLYASNSVGNPTLSHALIQLSGAVRRGEVKLHGIEPKRQSSPAKISPERLEALKKFDSKSVADFLADRNKTKGELIALASARFSMPTSQLQRKRVDEVRAALTSAWLHETSIDILSEEAEKDGENRTS